MSQQNRKGNKNQSNRLEQGREVAISKGLSYVLRHAAEREGLKMDAQGYANVADVDADKCGFGQLAWRKLKSLKTTFPEIVDAVATSDKKRFALLHLPSVDAEQQQQQPPSAVSSTEPQIISTAPENAPIGEGTTEKALAANDPDPSHFLIRATQGHSIRTIDAASLLEKLSLSEKSKLPSTVVHGTYHSAWPAILESRGLRCMGRNHVHFATGPSLESILPPHIDGTDHTVQGLKQLGLNDGQVISGMRKDAQVLIYVDLKRALAAGCPFWRSENGVILSEGFDAAGGGNEGAKVVPLEFFDVVVERKIGLGKIWEGGKVVQELPKDLTKRLNPKEKNNKGKAK